MSGNEALVGATLAGPGPNAAGAAYVLSVPATVPFTGAPASLSLAAGGQQDLTLEAGTCLATNVYFVLGTHTGTTPASRSWTSRSR